MAQINGQDFDTNSDITVDDFYKPLLHTSDSEGSSELRLTADEYKRMVGDNPDYHENAFTIGANISARMFQVSGEPHSVNITFPDENFRDSSGEELRVKMSFKRVKA